MPQKQPGRNILAIEPRENIEKQRSFHKGDFTPGDVDQRIILQGKITQHGLAADRPNGKTHIKQYFATDTDALSIWNGSSWVSVTLS